MGIVRSGGAKRGAGEGGGVNKSKTWGGKKR